MNRFIFILVLFMASGLVFSQEYEIAWEKDIGGSFAQFSKDGEFIYVAGGNTINKYRSVDGSFVSSFDNSGFKQNGTDFYGNFYLSNSGNYLIGICGQYYNIWDTKTEKAYFQFSDVYGGLDITNDESKYIAIKRITPENDRIVLLDFKTQKEIKSFTTNQNVILTKLSHNGKMFATASISGSKYYLTLWDTETLTEIKRFDIEGKIPTTTFEQIKFSFDDRFVGINTIIPYHATFFSIETLSQYFNSKTTSSEGIGSFDFSSDNKTLVFNYNDFFKEYYNVFIVDLKSVTLIQNLKIVSSGITSGPNNLFFTKYSLIRPKTVGVAEQKLQNISITNIKDLILINNNSEVNENVEFTLFDLQGKEIFRNSIFLNFGINKIPLSKTIQNGAYIIRLNSKNINVSQKLLIQR